MPLVVPLLRLAMVLLNVYETFKTLKTPAPSARHGGKPSVRAISQRKRDMKGCLTVWIVWCCVTLYERIIEGIISLFIPFYDELKALVLVFLILTRARSAEPIFLHLIRPVLKPYTPTLDMILDVTCMFGDIAYLIVTTPFRHAQAWWYQKPLDAEPHVKETKSSSASNPSATEPHITIKLAAPSTPELLEKYPPPPAYSGPIDGFPINTHTLNVEVDEWRRFPDAAYPASPVLPGAMALSPGPVYMPLAMPDESSMQGFRLSLPPRESMSPGLTLGSSDKIYTYGAHHHMRLTVASDDSDVEVDEELDITMRTPPPAATHFRNLPALQVPEYNPASAPSSAVASAISRGTGLTTNHDDASSFCTRSPSEADSDLSSNFNTSRKRVHPRNSPRPVRPRRFEDSLKPEPIKVAQPSRYRRTTLRPNQHRPITTTAEEGTDDDDDDDDDDDMENDSAEQRRQTDMKRRKVGARSIPTGKPTLAARGGRIVRPVTQTKTTRLRAQAAASLSRTSSSSTDQSVPRITRSMSTR